MKLTAGVLFLAGAQSFKSLGPDTWEQAVKGKKVMVLFKAYWDQNCKKLRPDWDRLMYAYEGSETAAVVSVECDGAEDFCAKFGVKKFPSIQYGDPEDLKVYEGPRNYHALHAFAHDTLHLTCGPDALHLCDDDHTAEYEHLKQLKPAELLKLMHGVEQIEQDVIAKFKKETRELKIKYENLVDDGHRSPMAYMRAQVYHLFFGDKEKAAQEQAQQDKEIEKLHERFHELDIDKKVKLDSIQRRLDMLHKVAGHQKKEKAKAKHSEL